MSGSPSPALLAALERVPRRGREPPRRRPAAQARDGEPRGRRAAPDDRGALPARHDGADLFIEAPDGLYVPMAKRLPDAARRAGGGPDGGLARFEVDLSRTGNAQELKGKTLTLTLVSDAGATETAWTVP